MPHPTISDFVWEQVDQVLVPMLKTAYQTDITTSEKSFQMGRIRFTQMSLSTPEFMVLCDFEHVKMVGFDLYAMEDCVDQTKLRTLLESGMEQCRNYLGKLL